MPRVYITISRENTAYLSDRLRELTDTAGELYAKYVKSTRTVVLATERPLRSFAPLAELTAPAGTYVLARYKHEKFELTRCFAMPEITWISSAPDRGAYLTIDRQQRLYVSSEACDVLGVSKDGRFSFNLGHDPDKQRLLIAKPGVAGVPDVRPFRFDKRRYGHALAYVKRVPEMEPELLPVRFEYIGRENDEYPDGIFAFQLAGSTAPDDAGRKVDDAGRD
jgi:hypothetical protein